MFLLCNIIAIKQIKSHQKMKPHHSSFIQRATAGCCLYRYNFTLIQCWGKCINSLQKCLEPLYINRLTNSPSKCKTSLCVFFVCMVYSYIIKWLNKMWSHLPLFGNSSNFSLNPCIRVFPVRAKIFPHTLSSCLSWSCKFIALTNRKLLDLKVLALLHASLCYWQMTTDFFCQWNIRPRNAPLDSWF